VKPRSWIIFVAAASVMLGTGWFLVHLRSFQRLGTPGVKVVAEPTFAVDGSKVGSNSVYLPPVVLDFQSEIVPVAKEVLGWLPEDTTYGQRLYKSTDGFQAMVNVVLMGADRTSIHKPEFCLTGLGWEIAQMTPDTIPIRQPHAYDLPVMKIEAKMSLPVAGGASRPMKALMLFWFVADGQLTARHNERMKWMARDLVLGGVLQRWAYVSCFTVLPPGQEDAAYERLRGFVAEAVPHFQLATGAPSVAQLK